MSFSYTSDLHWIMSTATGRYEYSQWKKKAIQEVSTNPNALKYESEWWNRDADIVRAAIIADPFAIRYAPFFQNDKDMVRLAVKINGLARVWANKELQDDPEIKEIAENNLPTELPLRRIRKYFRSPGSRDTNIYCTNYKQCKFLRSISNINEARLVDKANPSNSFFIRDSSVTLFEGKRLIPYSFKSSTYHGLLKASLPESANHFLLNSQSSCGKGFLQCNVEQAMINAIDFDIPFKRGKTCIEGGNCFLFNDIDGRKAILGEVSLFLSMIALEEQRYFDNKIAEISLEPSLDALRIARNRHISLTKNQDNKIELNQTFTDPITNEDEKTYYSEARVIEAKLALTKICIAEELEIPLSKVVFLPQGSFHIDMELFITPHGEVILHDDGKVIDFLNEDQFSEIQDEEVQDLLIKYKINAEKRSRESMNFFEKRELALNSAQIRYRYIPAVFESPESNSALNYCNGIFSLIGSWVTVIFSDNKKCDGVVKENGYNYITTGPSTDVEKEFHLKFIKLFQQIFPEYRLKDIPDLSKFIARTQGGIHCLTFENYLVTDLTNVFG